MSYCGKSGWISTERSTKGGAKRVATRPPAPNRSEIHPVQIIVILVRWTAGTTILDHSPRSAHSFHRGDDDSTLASVPCDFNRQF